MTKRLEFRERNAVTAIIAEMKDHYENVDNEHFIDIVVSEAKYHGIRKPISDPLARALLNEMK